MKRVITLSETVLDVLTISQESGNNLADEILSSVEPDSTINLNELDGDLKEYLLDLIQQYDN